MSAIPHFTSQHRSVVDLLLRAIAIAVFAAAILVLLPDLVSAAG
jgi:hypothetical protein